MYHSFPRRLNHIVGRGLDGHDQFPSSKALARRRVHTLNEVNMGNVFPNLLR